MIFVDVNNVPGGIYLVQVNNGDTRRVCEIYSKLIKFSKFVNLNQDGPFPG